MSTYVYMLLVFFLLLLVTVLMLMNNTRLLSNKIKSKADQLSETLGYTFEIIGGDETYAFLNEEYEDQGFTITALNGSDISRYVTTTSNVDTSNLGTYKVNYKVTYNKKTATYIRYVHVIDKIIEIEYQSRAQVYTVPMDGYYKIELWGAQGGSAQYTTEYSGGLGSYTSGYIYLDANEKLYIYTGGNGQNAKSNSTTVSSEVNYVEFGGGYTGYNGGGYGNGTPNNSAHGGGGGATDIRYFGNILPTANDLLWDSTLGLNSRIMVAAGGGGASSHKSTPSYSGTGGTAGGLVGSKGIAGNSTCYSVGLGASQVSAGGHEKCSTDGRDYTACSTCAQSAGFGIGANYDSFGTGDTSASIYYGDAGGGGGYYGGAAGSHAPGGAGSSFISGYAGVNAIASSTDRTHTNNTLHYSGKYFIDGVMEPGVNSGNGKARITFVSTTKPTRTNTNLNNVRYIKDCINGNTVNTINSWNELQAIKDGVNLAKGKTVTTTGTLSTASNHSYSLESLVNGSIDEPNLDNLAISETGLQCVTVDLGQTYDLDEISVWHMWEKNDGRTFNDNVTSVSSDNSNWTTIMNYDAVETANGKRVSAYKDTSNLFVAYAGMSDGVSVSWDESTSILTLNGTLSTTSATPFAKLNNMSFNVGDQYEFTLTYESGSYTTTANHLMVIDILKNGSKYATRTYGTTHISSTLPTSGDVKNILTINSSVIDGNGMQLWMWQNAANGTTFNNYRVKAELKKIN